MWRGQLSRLATSSVYLVTYGLVAFAMSQQGSAEPPLVDPAQLQSMRDGQQLANLINMAVGTVGFVAQFGTLALGRRRWAVLSVRTWALGSGLAGVLGFPVWRGVTAAGSQLVDRPSAPFLLAAGVVATTIVVTLLFELLRRRALNPSGHQTLPA